MPNTRPPKKRPPLPAAPELVAFGQAVREARLAQGLSQDALAQLAQVDSSHIGRIERGDHNLPLLTILRLADALGLPIAQLMAKAKL